MDWTAACQDSLSITNSWSLLKLLCIELVMPSNHLILCRPLLLLSSIFPSIRVFSNESAFQITWPKYWSFSFSIRPSNEYSGFISFKIDWFDLLHKWFYFFKLFFCIGVWLISKQCCDSFRWKVKGLSHTYHVFILPQTSLSLRLPYNIEQSSMYYTGGPCCLSIFKYSCVYMSTPNSQTIPSPQLSPWQP